MSVVVVAGDGATTTTVGLATVWPARCIVTELDARGGALAAWLEVTRRPNLSSLAAAAGHAGWEQFIDVLQRSDRGVDVVVLPSHPPEARAVVSTLVPVLGSLLRPPDGTTVIVDAGEATQAITLATIADAIVVVHRQRSATAATAALGIERLAGVVSTLGASGPAIVVGLIGERPYRGTDVASLFEVPVVPIAADPWGADVLAGRPAGRGQFARSPLARTFRDLAQRIGVELASRGTYTAAGDLEPVQ